MMEIHAMDLSEAFSDDESATDLEANLSSDVSASFQYLDSNNLPYYLSQKLQALVTIDDDEKFSAIYAEISNLINKDFDVTWDNYSCLICAIKSGHIECMIRCIQLVPDKERESIIKICMNSNNIQPIQKLLFAVIINNNIALSLLSTHTFNTKSLSNILIQVVRHTENLNAFDALISLCTNFDGPNSPHADFDSRYNLLYNALISKNKVMVNALLNRGALTGNVFQRALCHAIENDDITLLELLLNHNCSVNELVNFAINGDWMDVYPIEAACHYSSEPFCLKLLEAMSTFEDVADVLDEASMRGFVTFIDRWLSLIHSIEDDVNFDVPFQSAIQLEDENMLRTLAKYKKIPVDLINFACRQESFSIISLIVDLPLDTTNERDAVYACIALYENEFFDEFESLLKLVFTTLDRSSNQQSIIQIIVIDTEMKLSQRNRLLEFCLNNCEMTADEIRGMIYIRKRDVTPKPVARNLFATDFREIEETKIPYIASLVLDKDFLAYKHNKQNYITTAFSRNDEKAIVQAVSFAAFNLDISTFDFILEKITRTYQEKKLFENKAIQMRLLRAILYASSECDADLNTKLLLFRTLLNEQFTINEEFIAEAVKYDKGFAAGILIYKVMVTEGIYIDLIKFSKASSSNAKNITNQDMDIDI